MVATKQPSLILTDLVAEIWPVFQCQIEMQRQTGFGAKAKKIALWLCQAKGDTVSGGLMSSKLCLDLEGLVRSFTGMVQGLFC